MTDARKAAFEKAKSKREENIKINKELKEKEAQHIKMLKEQEKLRIASMSLEKVKSENETLKHIIELSNSLVFSTILFLPSCSFAFFDFPENWFWSSDCMSCRYDSHN